MSKVWYGVYNTADDTWWYCFEDPIGDRKHEFVDFPKEGVTYGGGVAFLSRGGMEHGLTLLATAYSNVDNMTLVELVSYKMSSENTKLYRPNFFETYPLKKLCEEYKIELEDGYG